MNADLARERAGTSFRSCDLTYLWYGGRENTHRRRYIGLFIYYFHDQQTVSVLLNIPGFHLLCVLSVALGQMHRASGLVVECRSGVS